MTFVPARVAISAITQANPAVVTTTSDHNLTTGQIVRLHVPMGYGMVELNQGLYSVDVLSATMYSLFYSLVPVKLPVNSTSFAAFTTPATPSFTAESLAVGSGPVPPNTTAWQSVNNFCESLLGDATVNNSTSEIPF